MTTEDHEGDEDHLVSSVSVWLISLLFLRMNSRFSLGLFLALAFLGSLVWAHSRDPFHRTEFKVQGSKFKVSGITVLPRGFQKGPVVVYAHGSGGTWMTDGNDLRQFAELGMAAVGFDYDQTNPDAFEAEFAAVLDYVRPQTWADTNSIAWVGFSLGAQNTLRYLLNHPENRPQIYVRLAGGWISELEEKFKNQSLRFKVPILLAHGENDSIFPVQDAKRLSELLRTNGTDVILRIVPGHSHGMDSDQPVVFRLIAEYCKAKLTPGHSLPEFPRLHPYPFLVCIVPAFVWVGFWGWRWRRGSAALSKVSLTKLEIGLRVGAVVLGMLAVTDTALHLVPPRMAVTERTLALARKYLLAPKWHEDFESLAAQPIWQGQHLGTLLTHVELAHYTVYELVNWKLDDAVYRQFVVSPVIEIASSPRPSPPGEARENELNWRRELWENFYPRVRHENATSDAAAIVVRFLRQRVTIAPGYPKQPGIESMWSGHIVNPEDFEILYVAALRSVGVPARLSASHQAEFWTGQAWQPAPPPLATTWVD
jgi:dienelactone hydrolase